MRINKFIAHATGLSRREADDRVERGRVTINGLVANMGAQVSETDSVMLDGKRVGEKSNYTYLMLNKPVGYLCSRRSQGGVPTIYELLPPELKALKAVGRLDKDSSGLILLTDDGDFAHSMTHPSFHKVKVYEVKLNRPLEPLHQQMISDYGVNLEDGVSRLSLEKIDSSEVLSSGVRSTSAQNPEPRTQNPNRYRVTMSEGRNRQIRRTFAALGYTVTALHRTNFGKFTLSTLESGKFSTVSS